MMPGQMHPMQGGARMPMPNSNMVGQMPGGQQMRPNQVNTNKLEKQISKGNTPGEPKKNKPLKTQEPKLKGDKTKSPTVKRPKEIQYSRLLFIQHYFNGSELKLHTDDKDEPQIDPVMDEDEKDPAENQDEDKKPDEENADESKPADDEKKEEEDANQIDSGTAPKAEEENDPDERVNQEVHDPHESENGDVVNLPNPYENDEPLMLEINSKSKSKCLKKVILEKKNLEGSQMLLFK